MNDLFEIDWRADPTRCLESLASRPAVGVYALLDDETCRAWVASVHRARSEWTSDFAGAQFTLGRAFYTHYETDRSGEYFADAQASDARVEKHLPGMQARITDALSTLTGGRVRSRRGWCGAGVHVFPAGGAVARRGGVVHFDVEGLAGKHAREARRAVTLVIMLQAPESGGGLRLWDVRYRDRVTATRAERDSPHVDATYARGSALLVDSYRLHQILPFSGALDRISITLHAAEVDANVWETWF